MKTNKICPNNTRIIDKGNAISIVLHNTEIVTIEGEAGTHVTLRTGGWKTATTKARMNQVADEFCLRFHVYQEDGGWFVQLGNAVVLAFDGDEIKFDVDRQTLMLDAA